MYDVLKYVNPSVHETFDKVHEGGFIPAVLEAALPTLNRVAAEYIPILLKSALAAAGGVAVVETVAAIKDEADSD